MPGENWKAGSQRAAAKTVSTLFTLKMSGAERLGVAVSYIPWGL